jgi:hypothetical protein
MAKTRRVYVVGAYIPNGGTYMAYQLGRLIQLDFGHTAIAVRVGNESPDSGTRSYDIVFPSVSVTEMEAAIRPDDLLIANPSFSALNFGLRLCCRKLMYLQGFNTFNLLDLAFDRYVCVSDFVSGVMSQTYGIRGSVIPAFIQAEQFPPLKSWEDRPQHVVLVHQKGEAALQKLLFERLKSIIAAHAAHIRFEILPSIATPHPEFVRQLGEYRHLVTLAAAEGFGLVPLEAMAMGTTVVGFDGYGGRQYMRPNANCLIAGYPDIEGVARHLIASTNHEADARKMAAAGRASAAAYSYERFRNAWIAELQAFMEQAGSP